MWFLWGFMCQDHFNGTRHIASGVDLDEKIVNLSRTIDCFNKIHADPLIELKLPSKNSRSGQVVKHAIGVVEDALQKYSPMVFKCGFTHCPVFRFRNHKFGYALDPFQKWERMIILFASHEPIGPSFLEGCLIQKFKGTLNLIWTFYTSVFFRLICSSVLMVWSVQHIGSNIPYDPTTNTDPTKVCVAAAMSSMEERPWAIPRGGPFLLTWCTNHFTVPAMRI